jgi:hypothetical protein
MWCYIQITLSLGQISSLVLTCLNIPKKPLSATKLRLNTHITRFQKFSISHMLTVVAKKFHNWNSTNPNDLQEDILERL